MVYVGEGGVQFLLCLFCLGSGRRKAVSNIHLSTMCPKYMFEYCVFFHDALYTCNIG